ncbi:MAG: isoleucine--tRNA ligase [Acholeplasmatales bacterium]|nr:MAG: isoleucine--tRNA ligase [Acholeplasmatales bacterium]
MKDYKETLLMPKTEFPMRGNLGKNEPTWQEKWAAEAVYEARLTKNEGNPTYTLHDGPPYANGDIHIGHALNKVLKDIIVRERNMRGRYARYVPGWDTHGLPIESALTNKEKVDRKKLTLAEFREKCADYAMRQIEIQRTQFKRLGVLGEWDKPYVTLDKNYEASQLRIFAKMVEKGLIFKGLKPVFWSPSSETALAEAEIEYQDKKSPSVYVALEAVERGPFTQAFAFLIWTTTPWTIPANLAVAVNEGLDYVLVRVDGKHYVFAQALLDTLKDILAFTEVDIISQVKGSELLGCTYKHPLYDRISPILPGHHVTTESGTGLVHIAPGHGEDDFIIGQSHGLETLCPVNATGHMTAESGPYEGLFIEDCSKAVVQDLDRLGALLKMTWVTHSYPHDWRTKQPVIFRATDQWFASIESLKQDLLAAVHAIEWTPKWGAQRMENMIKDRAAWCISRQRAWGVPIPVFYHEDGSPILDSEIIEHVADLFAEHGSNIWFTWPVEDLLPSGYADVVRSPQSAFRKETDILDVWFDSGTSHLGGMVDFNLPYPADLYLEGSDQYRGWFNSSLSTGIAANGKSPYLQCVTHGFVLDGEGRKMSKSLGNVVDPIKVMDQLGADILRLWVASVDYQSDVRISQDMMKQVSEHYRKIRNTFRFMLGALDGFNPNLHTVKTEDMPEIDRYMMQKLHHLIRKIDLAYAAYQFDDVTRLVTQFVTRELSAFYLDYTKDILYIERAADPQRLSVQTVIYEALTALLKLMTPIIPHTTEEAYAYLPGRTESSVYLENMPESKLPIDTELLARYDAFMHLRDHVLKALEEARNEKVIGKSLQAHVVLYPDAPTRKVLDEIRNLDKLCIVSALTIQDTGTGQYTFPGVSIDILRAEGETCARCWHVREVDEASLCDRCRDVIEGR